MEGPAHILRAAPPRDMTPEEQQAEMKALTKEYEADADKIINDLQGRYGIEDTPLDDDDSSPAERATERATEQAAAYRLDAEALFKKLVPGWV